MYLRGYFFIISKVNELIYVWKDYSLVFLYGVKVLSMYSMYHNVCQHVNVMVRDLTLRTLFILRDGEVPKGPASSKINHMGSHIHKHQARIYDDDSGTLFCVQVCKFVAYCMFAWKKLRTE